MGQSRRRIDLERELLKLLDEQSFFDCLKRTVRGLGQPKDTGDYKWAKLQIFRLWAPVLAFVLPASIVLAMAVLSRIAPETARMQEVTIEDPKPLEEALEEIKPIEQPQEEPERREKTGPTDEVQEDTVEAPAQDYSPAPAPIDSVAVSKSPVKLRGIVSARQGGAKGAAMKRYSCPPEAETAVIRSLRWLKHVQEPDGSWTTGSGGGAGAGESCQPAMTGLALLCFLGHGETPTSEEFGLTVQKAITWLLKNQQKDGTFANADGQNYSLAIATYALAEAYTMTQVPAVKTAAERSLKLMLKRQHERGGWRWYTPNKTGGGFTFVDEVPIHDDTSITGWCVQALKAAKIAGLKIDNMDSVLKKAGESLKGSATPSGSFHYLNGGVNEQPGGSRGLAAVGVLCLQLVGQEKSPEVQRGMKYLSVKTRITCDWSAPWDRRWSLYYWYYMTQANFHAGGDAWKEWNKSFSVEIPAAQTVLPREADGKDTGYWESIDEFKSRVYATTLCTLMLEVYYRFLPSYAQGPEDKAPAIQIPKDEIDIKISI